MTSFVYVYLDRVSQSDELRWSIRSVKQHFQGEAEIVIAGDRPAWYQGRCLDIGKHKGTRYRDTHMKLAKAIEDGISEKFVWMMDDIYFLRDFSLKELEKQRRARRWIKDAAGEIQPRLKTKSGWSRVKARTVRLLFNQGLTKVHDYATHMPHVMTCEKSTEIFNRFDLRSGRHLHELIYGNIFPSGEPITNVGKTLCYLNRAQKSPAGVKAAMRSRWVLVNNNRAWNKNLRQFLSEQFPVQSDEEVSGVGNIGKRDIDINPDSEFFGMSKRERMIHKMMAGKDIYKELAPARTASNFSCEYKGAPTRKTNGKKCSKRGGQQVFKCSLHGEATREKATSKIQSCNQCHVFHSWLGIE